MTTSSLSPCWHWSPDGPAGISPPQAGSRNRHSARNKAEGRKLQWTAQRERLWAVLVCVTAFVFITTITAEVIYAEGPPPLSQATEMTFTNGNAIISIKDLPQGELQRYAANVNGTRVRFLLYRKPDNKIASVFDACQICGGIGFYKGATGLICKNCAAPINPQSVGQPGGCNPIPLQWYRMAITL